MGAGPRGGGLHYNNHSGGTATIDFEGARVTLIHKAGPDCGIAQVEIDGQPAPLAANSRLQRNGGGETLLDTYSPLVEWNRNTVIAESLAPGLHTLTVRVTGRHHPDSSDCYVQIVACEAE